MAIILLGILGAVISAVLGTLWYSKGTPMGKIQLESIGFTKLSKEEQDAKIQEMKPKMWKSYLAQLALSFLTSAFIAFVMQEQKGLGTATIYGEIGAVWLCFVVPLVGQALLWSNVDPKLRWKKFFSESFFNLVTFIVIIFIFSFII